MKKSNEQILIENGYTYIKQNPDTKWVQIAITEDNTVSAFWVPNQLVDHLSDIYYLRETIGLVQKIKEKDNDLIDSLQLKAKEYQKKIDSQRKSVEYYKNERETYKRIANKQAKDWEVLFEEFKNSKTNNAAHICNLEEANSILSMEVETLNDELKNSQSVTLKSIVANVILILVVLTMLVTL